jgi:hypothetical protein
MADQAEELQVLGDLVGGADAISRLSESEETFRATVDAFRAKDGESFRALIERHGLAEQCELVCRWLRSKECVVLCLELCGPPRFEPSDLPDVREFAEVVSRLTADEELVELMAQAVQERDVEAWRELIEKHKLERYCHPLCHWVCTVHWRRVCEVVCEPVFESGSDLIAELRGAGAALGALVRDEGAFETATEAVRAEDCGLLRRTVAAAGLGNSCHFICEWFCSWHSLLVCLPLCRPFPFEDPEAPIIGEMLEFARACGRLAGDPIAIEHLNAAVARQDAERFSDLVKELELGRFCIQLCHWICFCRCRGFCVCVCPSPEDVPHWTQVEVFDIHPPAGNPGAMFTPEGYAGNPATLDTDAFVFGELPTRGGVMLSGNCPLTDISTGNPLEYRFMIGEWTWSTEPDDPTTMPSVAPAALSPVTQIEQTLVGHIYYSDPLSPAPVYITAADAGAEGWIQVNGKEVTVPLSVKPGTATMTVDPGNFVRTDALLLLNSAEITAEHPAKLPGGLAKKEAGRSLATGEQEPIRRYRLEFEARDGKAATTLATDTLSAIILNNSPATVALDLEELLSSLCRPLAGQAHAHVLYTVDHPHLRSFAVSIANNGGQVHPPPAYSGSPTVAMPDGAFTAGGFFFRGGASGPHIPSGTGGVAVDISGDPACAYRVDLTWQTRRYGDSGHAEEILYCK